MVESFSTLLGGAARFFEVVWVDWLNVEFGSGVNLVCIGPTKLVDGCVVVFGVAGVNASPSLDSNSINLLRPRGEAAFGTGCAIAVASQVG